MPTCPSCTDAHRLGLQVARRAFNAAATSSVKRVSQALVERFQSDGEVAFTLPQLKGLPAFAVQKLCLPCVAQQNAPRRSSDLLQSVYFSAFKR